MRIAIAALLCTLALQASAKPRAVRRKVVRWAHAEASKAIYMGQCPVRLVFTGTILAARPGEITFMWKRSDGMIGPSRTLTATRRGQAWRVQEEWELSGSTRGWAQVWIPAEQYGSSVARFHVRCK
ncbi:MAG: hypothetical protein ACXWLR_05235 [Myxococcales bacterium]